MADWKAYVRAGLVGQPTPPEDDVVEELAQHAAASYAAARAEGATDAAARKEVDALLEAWRRDAALLRRPVRRLPPVDPPPPASGGRLHAVVQHGRHALRRLRRQPGHSALVVLTMALGIGTTTLLFSVAHGVLLEPLPWPEAHRLVRLQETREAAPPPWPWIFTNSSYLAWQQQPETIEGLAAWGAATVTLTEAGHSERVQVASVTASLFPLLQARAARGTTFTSADEAAGGVLVLSHGLWRRRFGGDEGVLGRQVQLDGAAHRISGVMPPGFVFPDHETQAWVPRHVPPVVSPDGSRGISLFSAVARLRPGVTAEQAAAEATARARHAPDPGLVVTAVFGKGGPAQVTAVPVIDALTREVRPALLLLLAAVGLLLATATANVAGLQLVRATARRRELALRAALGAGRGPLARMLLFESVVLGLAGGLVGLGLAVAAHRALPALLPEHFPRLAELGVDWRVAAFAAGLALVTGVVFGLLPVLLVRRLPLLQALAENGQASVGAGRSGAARLRHAIVAGQVAVATVLLLGALQLGRSVTAMLGAERGFDTAHVLTARLPMPDRSYPPERRTELVATLLARVRTLPGVTAAGVANVLPLGPGKHLAGFAMPAPDGSGEDIKVQAHLRQVSPGYFEALGRRPVAGRLLGEGDTETSRPVVVVNETFARRYLGSAPLGQQLPARLDRQRVHWEVVGVVADVVHGRLEDDVGPELFASIAQLGHGMLGLPSLAVRTTGEPRVLVPWLRAEVQALDPGLVLDGVAGMRDRIRASLAWPRLYSTLLAVFAVCALAVAAVALFGTLSYMVALRTREIGVRVAVGARPKDVVRWVLRQGGLTTAAGLILGLGASLALASLLRGFLYGVGPHDATGLASVTGTLLLVGAAACAWPARRAAQVDPQRALRAE